MMPTNERPSSTSNTITLAICGGGLGGLMLAHVLSHYLTARNPQPPTNAPDLNADSETPSPEFKINIYESSPSFSTIGAGIMIWSRTYEILKEVGLGDVLESLAAGRMKQPKTTFRYGHQASEGSDFYELDIPYGTINLHRAELLTLLTDALQPALQSGLIRVHFNKKLASYTYTSANPELPSDLTPPTGLDPTSALTLHFTDTTHSPADILIGSDGVRSATRASMYTYLASHSNSNSSYPPSSNSKERTDLLKHVEPSWTGTFAYRALADPARLPVRDVKKNVNTNSESSDNAVAAPVRVHRSATKGVVYFGRDQHVITYPISQGKLINVIGYISDFSAEGLKLSSTHTGSNSESQSKSESPSSDQYKKHGDPIPMFKESTTSEILQHFKQEEWEEDVVSLFGCIDTLSRWAITVVQDLPYLFDHEEVGGKSRVAIMGDAAHSMAPFAGSGVGQAMEDAYILGRLVVHSLLPLEDKKRYLNSINKVFKIYEKVRLPIIRRAFENTRNCGLIFEGRLGLPIGSGSSGKGKADHSDAKYKYDGRTLLTDELRPFGEEINRLYSWQWTEPLVNDEQWVVAERMLRDTVNL